MKTFLTTPLAILLFTVTCKAQNTFPATGSVGIGTTTPTLGTLQINGTNDLLSLYSTATGVAQFNAYNNIDFRIIQRSNAVMTFWTNTIERMRINQSGYIGIGTTTPTAALQIGNFANGAPSNQIIIPGSYNFEQIRFGQIGNGNSQLEFVNHTSASNSYGIKMLVDVDHGASGLQIQYAPSNTSYASLSYTTGLYLNLSGNVGIGTTTPDQKLTVNGTMHSKAVVVDNSIFPDYVFNKTYALRPLSAVKTYIDINHHLPEMPSAAEVAKNGQNLGEINALLLKKVEELTLYMIELNKTVKAQQQEIEALKKKN